MTKIDWYQMRCSVGVREQSSFGIQKGLVCSAVRKKKAEGALERPSSYDKVVSELEFRVPKIQDMASEGVLLESTLLTAVLGKE